MKSKSRIVVSKTFQKMTFPRVKILFLVLLAAPYVRPNGLLVKEFGDGVKVLVNRRLGDDAFEEVELPKPIKVQTKDGYRDAWEFFVSFLSIFLVSIRTIRTSPKSF